MYIMFNNKINNKYNAITRVSTWFSPSIVTFVVRLEKS